MRQDLLNNVLLFSVGAAVGSAVTYILMKKKYDSCEYEDYTPEEESTEEDQEEDPTQDETPNDSNNMVQYNKIIKSAGYSEEEKKKEDKYMESPYVIAADEFAEIDGFDTVTLYCYADGVLTDENDEVIEDVEGTVGEDSLRTFEVDGYDSVFVRNIEKQTDYEILRDKRRYSDIYGTEE